MDASIHSQRGHEETHLQESNTGEIFPYLREQTSVEWIKSQVGVNTSPEFIAEALNQLNFAEEPVVNEKWQIEYLELLSRFEDHNLLDVLASLETTDQTFKLFTKVFHHAFKEAASKGKTFSINAYLADLSDPRIIVLAEMLEDIYGKNYNWNITIEVLEHVHGTFDERVITHLKILKEKGFKLAIDDFSPDMSVKNISVDNLLAMVDNNIFPDYLKIDGPYFQSILSWKGSLEQYSRLEGILDVLRMNGTKVICEWVSNIEEWRAAQEKLKADFFQWRDLKPNEFNLTQKNVKVTSFQLRNDIQSFRLVAANDNGDENSVKSFQFYSEGQVKSFSLASKIKSAANSNDKWPNTPGGAGRPKYYQDIIDAVSWETHTILSATG